MNNKGFTLIEILAVVLIASILAVLSIPAVGTVLENNRKDNIINDAIIIENAAKLYCSQTVLSDCNVGDVLDHNHLGNYVKGINDSYTYTASKTADGYFSVIYNKKNELSFPINSSGAIGTSAVPSLSTRDNVKISLVEHGTITEPPLPEDEPYVLLTGSKTVYVEIATTYDDPKGIGYASDGSVIPTVWTSGAVDFWSLGTYTRSYECYSTLDNRNCIKAERTIIVQDTTAPDIHIIGNTTEYVPRRGWWSDTGAWASDNSFETIAVSKSGTVNTNRRGTYYITYTAQDSSGNASTATRTVIVY